MNLNISFLRFTYPSHVSKDIFQRSPVKIIPYFLSLCSDLGE